MVNKFWTEWDTQRMSAEKLCKNRVAESSGNVAVGLFLAQKNS